MTLGMGTMKGPEVDAGVYIRVDSLGPGQCFVSIESDPFRYCIQQLDSLIKLDAIGNVAY